MLKKEKTETKETKETKEPTQRPVVGKAEPAEGTVAPAEKKAVDLEEFEPHRKPKGLGVHDIAIEVRDGKWGTGQDRRTRLAEAGYNVKEVEDEVVRILNP